MQKEKKENPSNCFLWIEKLNCPGKCEIEIGNSANTFNCKRFKSGVKIKRYI